MSASNEWTIWHLTPRGWERGSEQIDFGNAKEKPAPDDGVLSFKYREYMGSMFSRMEKTCDEVWRDKDAHRVAELLTKFGPAPQRL